MLELLLLVVRRCIRIFCWQLMLDEKFRGISVVHRKSLEGLGASLVVLFVRANVALAQVYSSCNAAMPALAVSQCRMYTGSFQFSTRDISVASAKFAQVAARCRSRKSLFNTLARTKIM